MQLTPSREKPGRFHSSGRLPHGVATFLLAVFSLSLSLESGECAEDPRHGGVPNIVFIRIDDCF